MELSSKILSEITIFTKYAKYLPDKGRRETWEELVRRNADMHKRRFPKLHDEIEEVYKLVADKKVLPSMRSLQFGGRPIELASNRLYNCAYLPIDSWEAFHEIMFLLLGGSGVGYSVQFHHTEKLPPIRKPTKRQRKFLVGDSIEGWADAVKALIKAYFFGLSDPIFDFGDVRPKGTLLVTSGGRAPGPQPLKDCIHNLRKVLDSKAPGDKLRPIEVHDLICYIADAVLAGGIRRAALISLFSLDDEEMLSCKSGKWYELNPHRARANNSACILRHRIRRRTFDSLWEKIKLSGCGEPGLFLSHSNDWGLNPCQPARAAVLTPNGIRELGDIKAGDKIWCGHQFTTVIDKWPTGTKPVYEYHTRAGVFVGTENHRVLTNDEKIEIKDTDSIDVCRGNGRHGTSQFHCQDPLKTNQYVMDGLVLGDGTVHKASGNLVGLLIGQDDQDYFTSEVKELIQQYRPGITEEFYTISTSLSHEELPKTYERRVPKRYLQANLNIARFFLRGLYSANGSVVRARVTLKAASKQLILDVQQMLSALGIRSYYTINKEHDVEFKNGTYTCKESYDLNISTDSWLFKDLIGFIQTDKQEKLNKIAIPERETRGKTTYEIVDKVSCGEHEVFDLTVDHECHSYWTGGLHVSNCGEVGLRGNQFCNLTTLNASDVSDQEDLERRARAAAFIGTLQASYTNFHYLREVWRDITEKDALLGVGLAGVASGKVLELDLTSAAKAIIEENRRVAEIIGINPAARTTLVKPDGNSSCVLGVSSGIHAWHSKHYIRRIRIGKNEALYKYLARAIPTFVEDDVFSPSSQAIISIPIEAPSEAITREESALALLRRVKRVYDSWVLPGHISGDNTHNVSATISVGEDEWDKVGDWMWENRDSYNGITVLPRDTGSYVQTPFEEITKARYNDLSENLRKIDLAKVTEEEDSTDLRGELACAGGACSIL